MGSQSGKSEREPEADIAPSLAPQALPLSPTPPAAQPLALAAMPAPPLEEARAPTAPLPVATATEGALFLLPRDVRRHVLSFLDGPTLVRVVSRVCRRLHMEVVGNADVMADPYLWRAVVEHTLARDAVINERALGSGVRDWFACFRWIRAKGWRRGTFDDYLTAMAERARCLQNARDAHALGKKRQVEAYCKAAIRADPSRSTYHDCLRVWPELSRLYSASDWPPRDLL